MLLCTYTSLLKGGCIMFKKVFFFILVLVVSIQLVSIVSAEEKTQWTFDDETVDDWVLGGSGGDFYIDDGGLFMTGGDAWLLSPIRMQNFILEANITYESGHSGLIFRANKSGSERSVVIIAGNLVKFFSFPDYQGTFTEVYDVEIYPSNTYNLKLVVNNDSLKVYVDNTLAMEKEIAAPVEGQDYIGAFQYSGSSWMDHFFVTAWNENEVGVTPTAVAPTISPTPTNTPKKTNEPIATITTKPTKDNPKDTNSIFAPILIGVAAIVVVTIVFIIIKRKAK